MPDVVIEWENVDEVVDEENRTIWLYKFASAWWMFEQMNVFYDDFPHDKLWQDIEGFVRRRENFTCFFTLKDYPPESVERFVEAAILGAEALAYNREDYVVVDEERIERTKVLFTRLFQRLEEWNLVPERLKPRIPPLVVDTDWEPH